MVAVGGHPDALHSAQIIEWRVLDQRDVTLFDALWAFYQEHEYCGELDGGVEGERVWMTCTCGSVINRNADRD